MLRIGTSLLALCLSVFAVGQLPKTSITLFEIGVEDENPLSNPQYLTGFNPDGYNNQPSFFDTDILYLTSDWKAKGQTDILKLNLKSKSLTKITDTSESEYSPNLTPDRQGISCINVPPGQTGEGQIQLLWKYPISRANMGDAISYDIENVGYHHWIDRTQVALFLVDDPNELVILNVLNGDITEIDKNVGRCFKVDKNGDLLYVHKAAHNIWYLKTYNLITGRKSIIGETKSGSEDFDFLEDGSLIMGKGSMLFQMSDVGGWKEMMDLKQFGVEKITRLAIRNNKIAIVHAS